jgi:succinoglycan biosynthesis protein ExoL
MDAPTRPDQATTDLTGRRIVYFGHDRTDSKVIQRIEGLTRLGLEVVGFTYRRAKYNRDHRPRWRNVDLGTTVDYGYLQRLGSLVIGALAVWRSRREVAAAEAMIARNLDTALLALLARRLTGARPPLAYEVLDVHRLLVGDRLLNRALRLIERWVLARCDLLIVSSPAYVSAYFEPVQRYRGPHALLENKLAPGVTRRLPRPPARATRRPGEQRWTIGWCGTLRCVRSLDLLIEIARSNRDRVVVHIRGFPTETGLEAFLARPASRTSSMPGATKARTTFPRFTAPST